jgi:hypothetical protein
MESAREKIISRTIKAPNGCWEWTGAKNAYGYGRICVAYDPNTRKTSIEDVHRASFKTFNGPIPEGKNVCHSCDNPSCCNPSHLFIGSQKDNMLDMTKKGRRSNGEQHSNSIRKVWDDDLRQKRSEQTKARMDAIHIEKAKKAGVPSSWKYCPRCNNWFPRTSKFFHKNAARSDGFKNYCKSCVSTFKLS